MGCGVLPYRGESVRGYEGCKAETYRVLGLTRACTHTAIMSSWGSRRAVTEEAMFVLDLERQIGFRLGGESGGPEGGGDSACDHLLSLSLSLSKEPTPEVTGRTR